MTSQPHRALLVVDVQPTFCEGGELPVAGGNELAARVARFGLEHRADYRLVVTTQDWHVDPGAHFSDAPDFAASWPPHGVAGTPNAQLHPALAELHPDVTVRKGEHAAAYSGFDGHAPDGRPLADVLREAGVTQVDVVGLATDYCVAATARDALRLGFDTRLLAGMVAAVDQAAGRDVLRELAESGVVVVADDGRATGGGQVR